MNYSEEKRDIYFHLDWTRNDIRNLVKNNSYIEFGEHKDLKAMCCCPYSDEDNTDYEELCFIVPADWLTDVAKEMFDVDDLDAWLQNYYVTEESQEIFARALTERKVVMVDFN